MSCDETVTIDMDQEVTLTVKVSVGEKYSSMETLSQDLTAPLFVIKNVQIKDIAEKLCQRALQIFMAKLRDKELRRMKREESEGDENIQEGVEVEGRRLS